LCADTLNYNITTKQPCDCVAGSKKLASMPASGGAAAPAASATAAPAAGNPFYLFISITVLFSYDTVWRQCRL